LAAHIAVASALPDLSTTNSNPVAVPGNAVVARGQGFEVHRHEMDQVLATARVGDALANAALGRTNAPIELPPDAEIHVLNQLIQFQLVMQKTTEAERVEGRQKTEVKFKKILQEMGETKFETQLKATLMTADELRQMLFQEETAQTSLARQLEVNVTDADAKQYFDTYPGVFDEPEKAHLRELMLYTTLGYSSESLPAPAIQAKHQQIFELYKRFQAGKNFTALAKQYNEDIASKGAGGEVSFTIDQMEKGMGDLAFSMKPGQVSEVITNGDGYVFFQLLGITPAKKTEFADVADKIKRNLTGEQKRMLAPAYLTQLWKEADVEILDPKLKAAIAANEAEAAAAAKARTDYVAKQAAEATNTPSAKP
jgi:parvulin-like peptidyl-prolyl isomerase